jgi:hypothetical protein
MDLLGLRRERPPTARDRLLDFVFVAVLFSFLGLDRYT